MKYISHIDHQIRIKLKLNCLEYCFIDYLSKLSNNSKQDGNKLLLALGITINQSIDMILILEKKGFLASDEYRVAMVTDKWLNEFKTVDSIDELWNIHKAGSKQKARTRLIAVLKKIDMDELKKKLREYIVACNNSQTFPKNIDTWLNPKTEHWNDPLPMSRFNKTMAVNSQPEKKYIIK